MNNRFSSVSMNGRMAYIIMCVETFLVSQFPQKNWQIVARKMWNATSMNWGDWPEDYSSVIPDILLQYDKYESEEFQDSITEAEFLELKDLYSGITEGKEDDPSDEVNYMLNKPYEMAMVYEGSVIGDVKESFEIISNAESILQKHGISLPDYKKVLFSSSKELNGWGNDFDGTRFSVILNR